VADESGLKTWMPALMLLSSARQPLATRSTSTSTEGNEIPWWLCLAHTVHLHDIIHEGILQVKAKWQNRTLVLTVATTRRRCCVWYERETREFITETLDE